MRIVEYGRYYPPEPGGIQNNIRFCAHALSAEHDVHALVYNRTRRTVHEMVDGIPVTRAGIVGHVASQAFAPTLGWHLRRLRPDVVHLHAPDPYATLVYLLAAPGVPLVVTHHARVTRQRRLYRLVAPIYRAALARAAAVMTYTQRFADASPELDGVRHKVRVVPHGTDDAPYRDLDAVEAAGRALRRRLGLEGVPVAAFLGRHVHYKGVEVLLAAAEALPALHVVLAGEGPYLEHNRALAAARGLGPRVRMLGRVPEADKPAVLAAADVVVMPSLDAAEAFGQVQVEAQLAARPVVASRLAGVDEVTQHEETGLLVPPGDAGALADALRRVVADPEAARAWGRAGRRRAQARFVAPVAADALRRLFREVGAVVSPSPGSTGGRPRRA